MLYTEPHIFKEGDERDFENFFGALLGHPFEDHVQQEAQQLSPVFNAAAEVLAPYAKTKREQKLANPSALARAFQNIALAHRSFFFNQPIIMEEDFYDIKNRYGSFRRGFMNTVRMKNRPTISHDMSLTATEPSGGSQKNNRMFGTARFGLLSARTYPYYAQHHENEYVSYILPYVMLPKSFLKRAERHNAQRLIHEMANISTITNHDWMHSLLISTINPSVSVVSSHAPMMASDGEGKLHNAVYNDCECGCKKNARVESVRHRKLLRVDSSYNYEAWSMRLHREVLTKLADQKDNILIQSVERYVTEWKKLAAQEGSALEMTDPSVSPLAYGMKFLAFNLVRAVPYEHSLIQNLISDPDIAPYADIFEKIYQARLTGVLFGAGTAERFDPDNPNKRPKGHAFRGHKDYGRKVLDAGIHAFAKAHQYSQDALREARVRKQKAARLG